MPQDLAADSTTFDLTPPTEEQFRELVADLSDEEKHVLLEHGTEAPFCGVFLNEKRPGVFTCRLCGLPISPLAPEIEIETQEPDGVLLRPDCYAVWLAEVRSSGA